MGHNLGQTWDSEKSIKFFNIKYHLNEKYAKKIVKIRQKNS
jgi:hypothetical protein